ncbi:hypothetical protein V6N13_093215 [Hibiscus sabdariffa]
MKKKAKNKENGFKRVLREEGLFSFWRGNQANVIRYFPTQGYAPSNSDRREGALRRKRVEYLDCVAQFYDIPDTERTVPDVAFFQQAQVQKSLARILYTWAIRHPASRYVQGINDLVTPFLVVFLSEYLKGSIDNHYTFAQPGIQRLVFKPKELVRRIDEPVSRHMEDQGLEYLQFAFRWFNCLLIREFSFNGEHSSFLCAELSSLTAFLQPQGDAALRPGIPPRIAASYVTRI